MNADEIRELADGFKASRVLLTAFELGVFTALGESGATAAGVAGEIGADPRATERLLCALCALDLVEKRDETYRNTPAAQRHLVTGGSDFLASLGHTGNLWEAWSTLTACVREGHRVRRLTGWTENFIEAMHSRARRVAPRLVDGLEIQGARRMLDVGGGSGVFAMAFVQGDPERRATLLDLPEVIPIARRFIEAEGLAEQIACVAGDYNQADFGEGYDFVLLSAILHINSADQNRALLCKTARALAPGGLVVIREFLVEESRTAPVHAALFGLNMLVATERGDVYTESEIAGWLAEAGFTEIRRIEAPGRGDTITARAK